MDLIKEEQMVQSKFQALTNRVKYQDYIMPFGKYKGEFIADIKMEDRNYFDWMLGNMQESDLLEAIRWHAKED